MGPLVICLGCALLWYNEGVAIKTHRSLNEALDAYVNVPDAAYINNDNDAKLVHLSHAVTVDSPAMDDEFGLERNAVLLRRSVEMYQWVEHHSQEERKLQNGETEVKDKYTYSKEWRSDIVNSGNFQHPERHENPGGSMPFESTTFSASGVKVGALSLGSELTSQMNYETAVPIAGKVRVPTGGVVSGNRILFQGARGAAPDRIQHQQEQHHGNYDSAIQSKIQSIDGEDRILYTVKATGETFSSKQKALEAARNTPARRLLNVGGTQIGDVRVSFTEVPCKTVSVLAKQADSQLVSWPSNQGSGYDIAILVPGKISAGDMISGAQTENTIWTWVKRAFGWLLNFIGFSMLTSIISTTADITLNWIPFLGPMATSIIDLGLFIANFVLSLTLSVITAAVAWVFYRPLLGCTMLAGACGLMYLTSKVGEQ